MSITRVYRVTCDGQPVRDPSGVCDAWTIETDGDAALPEARAEAKRQGWTHPQRDEGVVDLCPDCSADVAEDGGP